MAGQPLPIACLLPARESRNQIGEWEALVAHQVKTERLDGGYAVTYQPEVASVVEDLARREAACCGFLDIATSPTKDGLRMVITSENPDALPVIGLLVGQATAEF